jgi:hypothetical protein
MCRRLLVGVEAVGLTERDLAALQPHATRRAATDRARERHVDAGVLRSLEDGEPRLHHHRVPIAVHEHLDRLRHVGAARRRVLRADEALFLDAREGDFAALEGCLGLVHHAERATHEEHAALVCKGAERVELGEHRRAIELAGS